MILPNGVPPDVATPCQEYQPDALIPFLYKDNLLKCFPVDFDALWKILQIVVKAQFYYNEINLKTYKINLWKR